MDVKFAYTILYVEDVLKTLEFYEAALGFERKLLTPEQDYGELNTGGTTIAFASVELGNSNFKNGFQKSKVGDIPFGIELAFTTEEVQQVMDLAVSHGAMLLEEMVHKPWDQQVGYLRDLNGFILEICSPMKA